MISSAALVVIGRRSRRGGRQAGRVEVSESDDDVKVVAALPGLDEKDIEVTLHDGALTLRGEKKAESQGALYSEGWQGRFERTMQLGPDVDPDKVNASYKNGVLTITAAKRPEAQRRVKRVAITAGSVAMVKQAPVALWRCRR